MSIFDEAALASAWNACLARDPVSVESLRRRTLADPNLEPAGIMLGDEGGALAGFALAVPPGRPHLFANPPGTGRIAAIGVRPAHRRKGLGTSLLERAVVFLKERGCRAVTVAAHEHFVPGVDREAYAEGLRFLLARGFRETGEAVAMGRPLYDLTRPPAAVEAERTLAAAGVVARGYLPGDEVAVKDFLAEDFPEGWIEFFQRKLDAREAVVDVIIACAGHRVIGYCQRLEGDHVGPFGVAEAYRGRGVGSVMLYRLLDALRARGFRFAWFGETGRAEPYYARAGFTVTRRYALLERVI